jgi:hypothetical protein
MYRGFFNDVVQSRPHNSLPFGTLEEIIIVDSWWFEGGSESITSHQLVSMRNTRDSRTKTLTMGKPLTIGASGEGHGGCDGCIARAPVVHPPQTPPIQTYPGTL